MRRLCSLLLVLAAAGCGSDKCTAPNRLEGTYTLKTINGTTPPVTLYDDPATGEHADLVSGSMTMTSSGTFTAPWSFRITQNGTTGPYSETCTGTFTRTGNHVVMDEVDNGSFCGGQFDADWDGSDTFTEGNVVYHR